MHLLIIGGSGRTGKLIIKHALSKDHTVVALVRDSSTFDIKHEKLTLSTGTPLKPEDIENAVASSALPIDAIIVALNSVRASDSPFAAPAAPPRLMAESHENLLSAMKSHNIKRIITISAFGVTDSGPHVFWPARMFLRHTNVAYAYKDHDEVDAIVRKSDVDWTLIRPVMLDEKDEAKEVKVFGELGVGAPKFGSISRQSVALFAMDECL
jgi:uncharacterized protein YbjT (DUF2867 family)